MRTRTMTRTSTSQYDEEDGDAPWLIVPLLLTIVLVTGLGVIFGWSV